MEDIGKMVMKNGSGMMVHLGTIQTGPEVNPRIQEAEITILSSYGLYHNHTGMMRRNMEYGMDIFVKMEVNEKKILLPINLQISYT